MRRHPVAARLVFYGLVVLVAVPLAFSHVILSPLRQATSPPPPNVKEGHVAADGLKLRTWTLSGTPERAAAVIVHGVGDSLESFTDVAATLNRRGHTVMLLDTRGHGGSEGRHMTLGAREREDVRAAMDRLRADGLAPKGVLLVGHSMGAVAVLRAAADRPDVRGVIAEAPYDDFRSNIAHHAQLLYKIPGWVPIIPISIAFAGWRAGFDADDVDAVEAARRIAAPLMLIVDGADPRMPERVVRRVFDAHRGPKRLWVAPGADHVGAILHKEYWPRVTAFLDESCL